MATRAETTAPTAVVGLGAGVAVNAIVAVAFWMTVSGQHANDWIGEWAGDWLTPVGVFLAVVVVAGIFFVTRPGWSRFGLGLIAGGLLMGILDLSWLFIQIVSAD